jgi:hypothetical protein
VLQLLVVIQMVQMMVMCSYPLDGTSLLLLFQQSICAKVRGVMLLQ